MTSVDWDVTAWEAVDAAVGPLMIRQPADWNCTVDRPATLHDVGSIKDHPRGGLCLRRRR
jgi:hypothetical protein